MHSSRKSGGTNRTANKQTKKKAKKKKIELNQLFGNPMNEKRVYFVCARDVLLHR